MVSFEQTCLHQISHRRLPITHPQAPAPSCLSHLKETTADFRNTSPQPVSTEP